jgi:hypothetical protein
VAKPIELKVHLAQDGETCLWYVAQSDVPGLRLEAETVHELMRKSRKPPRSSSTSTARKSRRATARPSPAPKQDGPQ